MNRARHYSFLTGYERDNETGLDFAQARYYSSTQGRFTSVDPGNAGAFEDDPQSWNGYAYGRNNPQLYTDPTGEKYLICKDGECYEHTDEEFANLKKNLGGLTLTGNGNFYERGNILDGDGNVVGQYAQTSIDNPEHRAIATIAGALAPVPKAFAYLYSGSVLAGTGAGGLLYAAGGAGTATTIGLGGVAAAKTVPSYVRRVLQRIKSTNGNAPSGYKGGKTFQNDGRAGGQVLPKTDASGRQVTYREYDVQPFQKGVNRGSERIVRGSDGSAYYTKDHYGTFTRIE